MRDRFRRELRALGRCFRPNENNSTVEKAAVLALIALWFILELGSAFGHADLPASMTWIREVVMLLAMYSVGRVHEREFNRDEQE